MSKQAFIHCGMPKTATTAIQRALADNRHTLMGQGIRYPYTCEDNHPAMILKYHPAGAEHWYFNRSELAFPEAMVEVEILENEMRGVHETLVISSEYLFEAGKCYDKLVRDLEESGHTPHFIFYVRHPVNSAISSAQQCIKMGDLTMAEAVKNPRWHDPIGPIKAAKAAGALVHVFEYRSHINVAQHFFDFIGADIDLPNRRANASMSMDGAIMTDLWHQMKRKNVACMFSLDSARRMAGEPFNLPDSAIELVRNQGQETVEFIKENFGIVLKERPVGTRYRETLSNTMVSQYLRLAEGKA